MNARHVFRVALALVMIAAWLAAADHCALAGVLQKPAASAHDCCPGHPAPVQKDTGSGLNCCKSLATPLTLVAKTARPFDQTFIALQAAPAMPLLFALWHPDAPIAELDPGPPRANSFAESVLKRSVRAHAPPSRLS